MNYWLASVDDYNRGNGDPELERIFERMEARFGTPDQDELDEDGYRLKEVEDE